MFGKRILILFLLISLSFGCKEDRDALTAEGKIPVRVFLLLISTKQLDYYKWAEETFEKANPNIDIIIEQFPGSSLKDFEIKLRLRFASQQSPDMFHITQTVSDELARRGLLAEAPAFIKEKVETNSLNEMVRTAPYYNGKLYGIASDVVWTVMYYNKQHFREAGLDPEKPPETWSDFLSYGEKLTKRNEDGVIERSGISIRKTGFKPGTAEKWMTFLYCAGGKPFSDDGSEVYLNTEPAKEALNFYNQVLFDKKIDAISMEGDQQGFAQGKASMFIREAHVIRWLQDNYPELEFGVAPIPKLEKSVSLGSAYLFAVSTQSSNRRQEAAWQFADFIMSDEGYEAYSAIGGLIPATKTVASLPEYQNDPYLKIFLEQEVEGVTVFPRFNRAAELLGVFIEEFCYGKRGVDETLSRAQTELEGLLRSNKRN